MKATNRNIVAGTLLATGGLTLSWFIMAMATTKMDIAIGALASVLGGAIGAGGATFSVYYMLARQKEDEIESISYAVLTEIAVLSKYIIGHLNLCEMIQQGFVFPKASLPTAFTLPEPIIYRAVAVRISRLPRPTQVVEFYTRLAELRGIVEVIVQSPPIDGDVRTGDVNGLADLLITQCQVAQAILANVISNPDNEIFLADGLRQHMLAAIEQQLDQAKNVFPNAESFR